MNDMTTGKIFKHTNHLPSDGNLHLGPSHFEFLYGQRANMSVHARPCKMRDKVGVFLFIPRLLSYGAKSYSA